MKKLPIGLQSFKSVREDGFLYVDKTRLLSTLAKESKYYFLSRPRRFGKSLLLSTLKAYFQGKRELFEGLAIAELEKDWKIYPVLFRLEHWELQLRRGFGGAPWLYSFRMGGGICHCSGKNTVCGHKISGGD